MRKILSLLAVVIIFTTVHAQTKIELKDSLDILKEQIEYSPDSADLHLKKASINMQLGQWEYAKFEYDTVLKRNPNNLAALFYRAYVNMRMRRYGFARADYNRLLMIVPGNYEALLGLAILNQREGRHTDAIDILNRMTSEYPDSADVYSARADIEKENKMYELAELDYAEAMKRDEGNQDYILQRADVLIRMDRKREAVKYLDMLTKTGMPKASLKEYYDRCKN